MSQSSLSNFAARPPLKDILKVPKEVHSVYSLTQHVWEGKSDAERRESKKKGRVRLETLDEFFIDPVRRYLNDILQRIAEDEGQGFWIQAEFGVGKSHLLAASAVIALGGPRAWDRVKQREDEEKKAGPGARLDSVWRKKIENKKIFPIVFSLEGSGGGHDRKLEDFVLEEAQTTFDLLQGKPLAVYPEEHLARLFLQEHERLFRNDLRTFLADQRLTRGLPKYEYDELIRALKEPASQRDAGRVLAAFYRYKNLAPKVATERGERLSRAVRDILEAGYKGVLIAIDEMSEYLRRSQFTAEDEDCLLTLSSKLAKSDGLPIWTIVAAQSEHTNPRKIIGPDRLREELLEHKAERFRDIVVQRTRTIIDRRAVSVYYSGYKSLIPWVKNTSAEDFEASFPFPPESIEIIRAISTRLTGTRSTIAFLHTALKRAIQKQDKDLVPLWNVFDDLMSYAETPSTSASGAISIRSRFREAVAALEAAQATLKRINDGMLARPQNRTRAERILNTLFLYHIAGVAGLTKEQILDAVCDLKPGEDQLQAQLDHYETLLDEMRTKLRNQIRQREGRYEFVPKESGQYDDLVFQATEKLKTDRPLFLRYLDQILRFSDAEESSPLADFLTAEEGRQVQIKVTWHGQERSGRVTGADLTLPNVQPPEIDTHGNEDDFTIFVATRPATEKDVEAFLKRRQPADPRLCVWAPAEPTEQERATLAAVMAHLYVAGDNDTKIAKEARITFRREASRAFAIIQSIYARGVAKTCRTSLEIETVGGVRGAIESMARKAMDTCYASKSIDFGNRKFDVQGAVKLINGLVKLGKAVSEGDQLWSAVENFAGPLGLVDENDPRRLNPSRSQFYQQIRERVEERGGAGLDIRTVYNWFTGYDPKDGNESPGLTRRMVDVYLLCLAQQGQIRISDRKGAWIDRSTIANIDFKPETLRGLQRIELAKAPEAWPLLAPYLEAVLEQTPGSLGTKYDQPRAEEALRELWTDRWLETGDLQRIDDDLKELFRILKRQRDNPFDDLLLFWLQFAKEKKPETFSHDEVFEAFARAVVCAAGVASVEELTSSHLTTFRENVRRLKELRERFTDTRTLLLRAARLANAPLPPDNAATVEIGRAQQEVQKELQNAPDLIINPDTVQTRLLPRLEKLEKSYVPAYLDNLMALQASQADVESAANGILGGDPLRVLQQLSTVTEAKSAARTLRESASTRPPRLRRSPEDRDLAEREVRERGTVLDEVENRELSFRRLAEEVERRREAAAQLQAAGQDALLRFAGFLMTRRIHEKLESAHDLKPAQELLAARTAETMAECLRTMPTADLEVLAKLLAAAVGEKTPKAVSLSAFQPRTSVLWDKSDINSVVEDFRQYLEHEWDDGHYLNILNERKS
jgi:hypothetical protein